MEFTACLGDMMPARGSAKMQFFYIYLLPTDNITVLD